MIDRRLACESPLAVLSPENFDEERYLLVHPDVAAAVAAGEFESGWQHFQLHGFAEGRVRFSPSGSPLDRGPGSLAAPRLESQLAEIEPEISDRDGMFTGNRDHYFRVGASALHCIDAALLVAHRTRAGIAEILDLPCGYGRVLRFLKAAFPHARLTACDLDPDAVAFCARKLAPTAIVSDVDVERIPLRGRFDLIWCGSLFTHLPAGQCRRFVQYFQQLLRPRGVLVFTTHGRRCADEIAAGSNTCGLDSGQCAELLDQYRRTGFGYVDYRNASGYGISLSLPSFVLQEFVQFSGWRLLGCHEAGWDRRQDAISLQRTLAEPRPANAGSPPVSEPA